ncbi:hypothetical protein CDEST_14296 [Colletotrichum destructivum]|uniref:Uncharacterized protein n=1 Tax=Colletotrichum destructivum TaxID=34406 RepID=A0AAX4J1L9_9PEZI|nr:hypothetical protein CDEST_14296 [Colletotrichum destructivum]
MWTVNLFPASFKKGCISSPMHTRDIMRLTNSSMYSTDDVSYAKMAWGPRMGLKVIGVLEKQNNIQHLQDTHSIKYSKMISNPYQRAPRSFVKDAVGGLVGRWTADARCTGD